MTRTLCATLATLVVALAPVGARQADDPLPPRLTLDEAITRAFRTSHRLAEARERGGAAAASADQRTSARRPNVVTSFGYSRTNHVDELAIATPGQAPRVLYPDVPNNYVSRIELRWPVYTGGRLEALERAAAAEVRATAHDLAIARADLKLEVTRAYWALVTARETARVLDEAVKRVDAQLGDVRSRFDAGFVPPNDVLTVEAQRARQHMLQIEAANQAAVAEADLARLVGAPLDAPITLDATLDAPLPPPSSDTGSLVKDAAASRPERLALGERIAGADERTQAAAAGRRPTVSFLTGADYARPNNKIFPRQDAWKNTWDVGVNVSWSLWDAGRTRAEVAEAAHLAAASRERLAEFDRTLATEIRQRQLDLDSARAEITAADEGVKSATEARRVVQERFTAGVATTTDLLDAQVALLQAELDRTRALVNTRLALARLDRALGR